MFRRSMTLVPALRGCCGALYQPVQSQARNISDITKFFGPRSIGGDILREMDRMERNLFRYFPPLGLTLRRSVPIEGEDANNQRYKVIIDADGYRPEDIKISMKDNVMKIEAKMDRTSKDGTQLQQSFVREFLVPDTVDQSTLKSFIQDGVLSIEAELLQKSNEPKAIPIEHQDLKSKI